MLMLNEARFDNISKRDTDLFIETYVKELDDLSLVSITQNTSYLKKITGPNNFTSLATYWHPNPDSPTGFPYIRKDGIRNNVSGKISDTFFLSRMIRYISISSFIYRITKSEEYCKKAVDLIRFFFLEEDSRMNPDLTYSGIVMGDSENDLKIRGAIIDTNRLPVVIDMMSLLRNNTHWTDDDEEGMRQWFGNLSDWFQNSPRGVIQSNYYHNIKTSYMLQLASYLHAAGKQEEARSYLEANVKEVLSRQIASDGSQPLEMERVTKLQYCNFNLVLLCNLAKVCSNLGVDIWDYSDSQGCGSIKNAMIYMCDMYMNPDKWTFTDEKNNSSITRGWLENGVSLYDDQILHDVYKQVKIYNFCNIFEHVLVADRKI